MGIPNRRTRPSGRRRRDLQSSARLWRARAANRALISLADAAAAGLTSQQVLDLVAASAATLTGDAIAHVWLASDDGRELRLASQFGSQPDRDEPHGRRVGPDEGLASAVAQSQEPILVPSLRRVPGPARFRWARQQGFVSFAGVRFARGERLLGALCLFARRRHRFTRQEADLLRAFGAHAAVALENAALFETAAQRLRRLEVLREIEREISQQRDPEALLELITRRAAELLAADTATIYLLDEGTPRLRARASFNAEAWVRDVALTVGEGMVGTVAQRRAGLIVNDFPRSSYALAPFRTLTAAVAAQPLLVGEVLHGVIVVERATAGRPFSDTDLSQLGDLAVQASIALDNARLLRLASVRAERVKAGAEVGRLLASTRDADRIIDLIGEKCRETLGVQAFGIFRTDATGRLRYVRGSGFDETFMREHTLAPGEGVVGKAAAERRVVETLDVLHDPALTLSPEARARIARVGSQALVGVPLLIRDELLGVLAVYHPPGFRFAADEIEFLETLANHAAAALENAQLFAETRRRQETAETLAAITQTLTGSLVRRTVVSLVAEAIRRLLGSEGGAIGLTAPDGSVRLQARVGLGTEAFRDVVVQPGEGVTGWVVAHGEPFATTDYANDSRITPTFAEHIRGTDIVGILAVPVRLGDENVGVLCAFYDHPVQISQDDITLASDLARVVAVAVANARLYQEARQREAEARALFEVGRLISGTLDPDRVLELVLGKVLELLGVRACGIFRLDDGVLRYARGAGLSPALVESLVMAVGEGTTGRCVKEGAPVWSADVLADSAIPLRPVNRELVEREGYRAVLSVPIVIQGAPFGALATYWWEPHTPTPGEVETLSSLATLAAVAFENARLFAETRRHATRLETLNQLNRGVSASLRIDEVLGQLARAVGTLFGAPLVTLWMADEERRTLTRRAGHGDAEVLAHIPVELAYGEGSAGRVAAQRAPLLDVAIADDPNIDGRDFLLGAGIRSFSGLPLILGERLLGVLVVGRVEATPLPSADLTLLQTLIGQAAIAIENARLFGDAQRHEAEAVALADATRRFGASLRREAILDGLLEVVTRVVNGRWSILAVEPQTGQLRPAMESMGGASGRDGLPFEASLALAHGAAPSGRTRLLRTMDHSSDGEPPRAVLERLDTDSVIVVPVRSGEVARAVLVGASRRDGRAFTERDLRLTEAIADRAGTALENARLFEELTQAYQDLKTAQEQLVRTEKLRALGEMASGVAHDFNNLLAAILGRVQLILRQVREPTLRRWLEVIEQAALDGAQTVRQIQEFTRVRRDQPTHPVEVHQVVHDAVEMTRPRWQGVAQSQGLQIRVIERLEPVPAVDGHPAELREALTNLILNAVDALPRGGDITIGARLVDGAVEVRVADTGVGMSEAVQRRVFEPFFSTKGPKGTGLGLAMVYGIVSRHGGEIRVESKEGVGSTFAVRLPASRHRPAPAPSPAEPTADKGIRVLVIDDEEHVREILADLLRLQRHEVVVAEQGAEGLARFREKPFDLVITDLAMPEMSGWQVAQAIKELRPEVPVVLVTGWGVEVLPDELRASGVDHVLTKPFRFEEVQEVVASLRRQVAARSGGKETSP